MLACVKEKLSLTIPELSRLEYILDPKSDYEEKK